MKKIIVSYLATLFMSITYAQESLRVIEIVTLNNGYNLKDHLSYGEEIEPILNKHGMQNLENFQILQKASGTVAEDAVKVGVFSIQSPENLKSVFEDKTYNEKYVPKRNKIHDMPRMTFFMAKTIFEKDYNRQNTILIDFVVLRDGYTIKDANKYFKKFLSKYGKKHGLKRFASYEILKFMRGVGPKETVLVNFYEAQKETTMKNILEDKQYQQKLVPVRNKIFNMNELSVLISKSTTK